MKNLPEDENMKSLKKRLATYAEEPEDDTWDKISAGLSKSSGSRWKPVAWTALFIGYSTLLWFGGSYFGADHTEPPTGSGPESAAPASSPPAGDTTKAIVDHYQTKGVVATSTPQNNISPSLALIPEKKTTKNRSEPNVTSTIPNSEKASSGQDDAISNLTPVQPPDVATNTDTTIVKESTALAPAEKEAPSVKKEIKKSRRSFPTIYIMAGPSLAYQRITPSVDDEVMITKLNSTGVLSTERMGWSAEGGVQWELSDKFLGYVGLSYYHQNGSISYSYQDGDVGSVEQSDAFNYVVTPRESTQVMTYEMRNAGVSIAGLYHLQGVKLRHYIGAGLQFQTGTLSSDQTYQNKGSMYLNYRVQYRMEFVMSRRYRLFAQPYYASALWSKENLDEPFNIRPYRAGLEFGWSYFFR